MEGAVGSWCVTSERNRIWPPHNRKANIFFILIRFGHFPEALTPEAGAGQGIMAPASPRTCEFQESNSRIETSQRHWAPSGFVVMLLGGLQTKYCEFLCECWCDPHQAEGTSLEQNRDFHPPQRASGHSQKGLEQNFPQNFPLGCSSVVTLTMKEALPHWKWLLSTVCV